MTAKQPNNNKNGDGPNYFVNIGGKEYPWSKDTITTADIRDIAGWDNSQVVEEINLKDGSKVKLTDDTVIEVKPGHGFSKKIEFDTATVTPSGAHGHSE